MARAHLRYPVKDGAGNVVQNAACNIYQPGTSTPVTGMWSAKTGGTALNSPLASNAQGEIEAWLDTAQSVEIEVTDNTDAAHYPSQLDQKLSWEPFRESIEVYPAPEDVVRRALHTNTADGSELAATVPIATTTAGAVRTVIFSQPLTALKTDEIIVALAEFELTNDQTYNVGVFTGVYLTAAAGDTTGTEIAELNGFNITPGMHHGVISKVGSLVSGVTGTRYVNVVTYAAATGALAGHTLTVEQDYGRLSVIRL